MCTSGIVGEELATPIRDRARQPVIVGKSSGLVCRRDCHPAKRERRLFEIQHVTDIGTHIERSTHKVVEPICDVGVDAGCPNCWTVGRVSSDTSDIVADRDALSAGVTIVKRQQVAQRMRAVHRLAAVPDTGDRRGDNVGRDRHDLVLQTIRPVIHRGRQIPGLNDGTQAIGEGLFRRSAGVAKIVH